MRDRDEATGYAKAATSGSIVVGRLVRLACQRHLRDLEAAKGKDFPYRFDAKKAAKAISFFPGMLIHIKGELGGQPIRLEPWQAFIVGSIFGWTAKKTGYRRFRTAYDSLARKNGKSTVATGIGILLAFFDDEPGSEVYCGAMKRGQAKDAVFDPASNMILRSPGLRDRIHRLVNNLNDPSTASKFEPLGADLDSMDGLNPQGIIIDELHAHKGRKMTDLMATATGSRRQPLQFEITTAGWDRTSVCWEHQTHSVSVLEGREVDEEWFAYIATIDEGDDPDDPRVWVKANPNLGVSKSMEYMAAQHKHGRQMPGFWNTFLRLHLNQWTEQSARWIDMGLWDTCAGGETVLPPPDDLDGLQGRECFAGLDLASTSDLTALVLLFPPTPEEQDDAAFEAENAGDEDVPHVDYRVHGGKGPTVPAIKVAPGVWQVRCRFWLPEDTIEKRRDRAGVDYGAWVTQGWISTTPGNVTDYGFLRAEVNRLAEVVQIREIAYDRWNASQLVTDLVEDGATMVPFGQGFQSMSPPMKELDRLILSGRLRHGANPVLRWMAGNMAVSQDPAGGTKPDKAKSSEKIDGIVALTMALGRAIVAPASTRSVYEERGIISI